MKLAYNDQQHAYWLDGKRCKGVTRVAKIPDDEYSLTQWKIRQTVIGLTVSPTLVQRAAAHFDERDTLDAIAEEALVAAKAHEASGRGTAVHRETERHDLGLDWIDTPETRAVRAAWAAALDQAGLDIVPELVERIVVYPDQLIAGRFDRIARRRSDSALVVVDVKTGAGAIRYPQATCVQLALYANAPLLAGPLTRSGRSEITETFEPMPDVDRDVGYVVHLPVNGDSADVYTLDIAAGWHTAKTICFPTITWRRRNGLINKLDTPAEPTGSNPRATWLRDRVQALVDAGHRQAVAAVWPAGVPTLKQGGLTDVHIDKVAAVLDDLEAKHQMPFGASDPQVTARTHTAEARAALEQLDPAEADAVARLVIPEHARTTSRHVTLIRALVDELADPNGAVMFSYSADGVEIAPTGADDRIRRVCRTKTEALHRAKRLAKELGRPNPRVFDHICVDPALAALVAAGLGEAEPTTTSSDGRKLT